MMTKTGLMDLYFDATGGLVKLPKDLLPQKRALFYTGVISTTTGRILPVISMISCLHDANTIFKLLSDFRFACEGVNCWPVFKTVVTDFSFANMHAIAKSFNRLTLAEYLTTCHAIVTEDSSKSSSLVLIRICCAHYMHIAAKDIDSNFKDLKVRSFLKDVIAALVVAQDMTQLNKILANLLYMLKSQYETPELIKAEENITLSQGSKNKPE